MKIKKRYLVVELIVLFGLLPCVFFFELSLFIKGGTVLCGVAYVIYAAVISKKITRKSLYISSCKPYWKPVAFRLLILILCTTMFMFYFDNETLFVMVRKNPVMWIGISLFYSIFSVYPQEFIYRSFFFMRYEHLFKRKYILIAVNAVIFSLGHVGFRNLLVLVLTLVGGFIFAITYYKTKSLLFTSIEHALYGSWLFTVGMGEMLAFPLPE